MVLFDLRAYAGKTIQIHFQATTDESNITSFYLDDIHLNVCTGPVATPTPPPRPTATPTIGPAPAGCNDLLENGDFETGNFTAWDTGNPATYQPEVTDIQTHGGTHSAWLGGYEDAYDLIVQDVVIPSQLSLARLSYWWLMETDEAEHPYDYLYVELLDNVGNELATLQILNDGVEYGWVAEVPWWLWYAAADQVRAELIDCSCWQPGAAIQPGAPPALATETPASTAVEPAVYVVNYHLALKEEKAGASIVAATRAGELVFNDKVGTQVISLSWGDPERRMHLYVSFIPGTSPQVALEKVVITQPVYSVQPQTATAVLVDGRAWLATPIVVGKAPLLLNFDCELSTHPQ